MGLACSMPIFMNRWAMSTLQNKPAQVFILREGVKPLAHMRLIDDHMLFGPVRGVEAELFEHPLQDRMQTAGADVLGRSVHMEGDVCHGFDCGFGEFQVDSLRGQECLVLPQQRGSWLAENAGEVVAGQVVHLDADRKPALKLGHEVRRFRTVEGSGGDEEDVVGLDRSMLGVDRRPFDDRQENALARPDGRRRARGSSPRRS